MLILRSYPVLLRVCLLVGMLIWPLLILLVLVPCLVLRVPLIGKMVLVLVEIFWLAVLILLLPLLSVVLRIGGSSTFLCPCSLSY